jgi:nitrogen fixation/metabolism regulation signal transduction histidine kinase
MPGRGLLSRRATDLVVVGILYAIVLAGSFAYVYTAMDDGAGFPDIQSGASATLLAITPTVLAIVLGFATVRFIKEYRNKTWGYRLRGRVMAAFMAVSIMVAVPSMLFLGMIAIQAVEAPQSGIVRQALTDGLDFAIDYYAEKEASLRYAAEQDVAAMVSSRGPDADRVLVRLSTRDPSICAVELFSGGRSISFAGDTAVQAGPRTSGLDKSGFLPRLSSGGQSYARYFSRDAGSTATGERFSVIVSLRFYEKAENAASALSVAVATFERSGRIAGSFPLYLVFFSACLVAPLFAIAALFALSVSDRLLRPLMALSDALSRVGSGASRAPFLAKPDDEAGDLIEALNALLENLERSRGDELRNEKIGAWRDIARKLAHELRNPLTPIKLSAERVLKRWKANPESAQDILEKSMVAIIQETANMESLLTEFRDFARLPEPQKDWMELKPSVEEAVHLYSASWPALTIDCAAIDPGIVLKADRGYLKQALGNLIANAADATNGRGMIWIRADLVKTAESRYCRIQIRDNGCGIPDDVRDRIFLPYFTTKPGGTGLGLAIVEHIVSAHGGKIRVDSQTGAGTVFTMDIPAESS